MKTSLILNRILSLFTALFVLICLLIPQMLTVQMNEPDLTTWLTEHPLISETIQWEDSNGIKAYPNWSTTQKADLLRMYQKVWNDQPLELTDPPPNIANPADDEFAQTVLSKDHAWPLFLAHVAYSLAAETGEWVPWSLSEYSQEELLELFDGSKMFQWNNGYGGYEPIHYGVPAPPDFTFNFLSTNNMIAQNRLQTIGNLLDWCRSHMVHFLGPLSTQNAEGHWQYRGVPPVSRVISGTTAVFIPYKEGDTSPPRVSFGHHTAGCWGTTAFLRSVLQIVNIPVKQVRAAGHILPYFMSEGKYLSHGDDPYSGTARNMHHPHPYPVEELFIDQATYDAWFGPSVPVEANGRFGPGVPSAEANVGRRTRELAIKYLPRALLEGRCQDIRFARSHADSWVYMVPAFFRHYSVEELEAINLWDRIDAKIERLGGCATLTQTTTDHVTISEIMVASNGGRLPQWIELHNHSNTQEVNLVGWTLEIKNRLSDGFEGELNVTLTFKERSIMPREILLIVTKQDRSSDGFPDEQIYNIKTLHPNLHNRILSEEGFYMKLSNKTSELVDEVGNLDVKRNTNDTLVWQLPTSVTKDGARTSIIRRYDGDSSYLGTDASGWISAKNTKLLTGTTTYYGHLNDIGAPGVRSRGALPVTLSHFRAERTDAGVILKWTTESEVDNAGFYIYRSKTKDGEFKVVNPSMIQGAGTTGERNTYTWTDTTAKPNTVYYYRIEDVSHAGVRQQLATVRLRGLVSAADKLTTMWADLKMQK